MTTPRLGLPSMLRLCAITTCALSTLTLVPLVAQSTGTRGVAPTVAVSADSLPARLSDSDFWRLISQFSETEGNFPSDNFTSNEIEVGPLSGLIKSRGLSGGVYMGVGPEQNFSYIAAIKPKMAFIVDIRRQAMVQHLMYKAIFEMSATRADFISMLFSLPRPARVNDTAPIGTIWDSFAGVASESALMQSNLRRIQENITRTHGFALSAEETAMLRYVYESFYSFGPQIGSRGPVGRGRGGSGGGGRGTNFLVLTQATGADGRVHTFLADENSYRVVKDLHARNLIVPVSGDFAGPKAIRSIGSYVSSRGARITAFYLSNVEQYLFQDNKARQFYGNVATLPLDARSIFIRPYAMRDYPIETSLCAIVPFLRSHDAGRVGTNNAALRCGS